MLQGICHWAISDCQIQSKAPDNTRVKEKKGGLCSVSGSGASIKQCRLIKHESIFSKTLLLLLL